MKAVLVMEMPINCLKCPLLVSNQNDDYICNVTGDDIQGIDFKQSWCPLRPLPSFKAVDLNDTRDVVMFCHGWNTCLAEITGETE